MTFRETNAPLAATICCYLLSTFERDATSSEVVTLDALKWVRARERPWFPLAEDLQGALTSLSLRCSGAPTPYGVVASLLKEAAQHSDVLARGLPAEMDPVVHIRREVPMSTLAAHSPDRGGGFQEDAQLDATSAVCTRGVVDPHVHQGAALGFETVIRACSVGLSDLGERDGHLESSWRISALGGRSSRSGLYVLPLLAGLRLSVVYREGLPNALAGVVSAAAHGDPDQWAVLRDFVTLNPIAPADWPLDAVRVKRDIDDWWDRDSAYLFLLCENMLFQGVRQETIGLESFIASFERFAEFRRFAGLERSSYLVAVEQEFVERTPGLSHVDLRLGESVFALNATESARAVASSVIEFGEAYEQLIAARADPSNGISYSFPVGFIKTAPRVVTPWRYDLGGLWSAVNALIDCWDANPSMWEICDGIDVCGDELAIPNWVVAPALEYLGTAAFERGFMLSLRAHAGESFWSPVNGLRAICDVLSLGRRGWRNLRIGHGLALASDDWSRFGDQPVNELLDDLLLSMDLLRTDHSLTRRAVRAVRDVSEVVFGAQARQLLYRGVAWLSRAYRERTSIDLLRRISFVDSSVSGVSFLGARPTFARDTIDELVCLSLADGLDCSPLREIFDTATLARLELLMRDIYESILPRCRELCADPFVSVEVCPTSNATIGAIRGMDRHPIRKMISSNIAVVVGSDDPAVFHAWLQDEFDLLHHGCGVPLDVLDGARLRGAEVTRTIDCSSDLASLRGLRSRS